jgi:hypothetical protein
MIKNFKIFQSNEEFAYHSSEKPIDNFLPLNKFNQNKSGYYNGVYFFLKKDNAFEFNKKGHIYKINIDNLKLYDLIDGDLLKKEAREAGFFINQGSGNESMYLKKIGFDGIKRGNEIIIFEPEKLKIEKINESSNFNQYNPDDILPLLKDFKPLNKLEVENFTIQKLPNDSSIEAFKIVPIINITHSENLDNKDRKYIERIKEKIKNGEEISPIILEFSPIIKKGQIYKFSVYDGHHRYIAYKELGKKEIPCAIITSREDYTYKTDNKNYDKLFNGISEGLNEGITNPNFWKWFGNSKVVDKNGNPLVVYHATNGDFDEFKPESSAYYFAENPEYASNVTHGCIVVKRGQNIMPVYLSIKNPKEVSFPINHQTVDKYLNSHEYLKELPDGLTGYDAASKEKVWVVFKQNKIKSATGNNGNFNPNSNNINENKSFPLDIEKWKKFYDKILNLPDNSNRNNGLDILYTIKSNNFYCTKFQYDKVNQIYKNKKIEPDEYIKDIIPNTSLEPLKKEKFFTTIPYSTIENRYMVMVKSLKQKEYNFFVKLLKNIDNRYKKNNKTDNKADVTEKEFKLLKRLETGNIDPKDYSTKN